MPYTQTIRISNILIDDHNPRLGHTTSDQTEAIRALAMRQGSKLLALTRDIVQHGLNPSDLPIVMPDGHDTYRVLDGNRRITAIKILEQPDVVSGVVSDSLASSFARLAQQYTQSPIRQAQCVVVESRQEALHWIELHHTGERSGAGQVPWGSDEVGIFHTWAGYQGQSGTQALDMMVRQGVLQADQRLRVPVSTLTRLLTSPVVRSTIGVTLSRQVLEAVEDEAEAAEKLRHVVDIITAPGFRVADVYTAQQREAFARRLSIRFSQNDDAQATPDGREAAAGTDGSTENGSQQRARERVGPRNTLMPANTSLNITEPRVAAIAQELGQLRLDRTPNAAAVLFRVFLELSVDAYLGREGVAFHDNTILRTRLLAAANKLQVGGELTMSQVAPVRRAASDDAYVGASVRLMHSWVHNLNMTPNRREMVAMWDDLSPFIHALWPF